jgi:hypothetical protein
MITVFRSLTGPVVTAAQNKAVRYTVAILIVLAVLCIALALALGTGPGHGPIASGGTIWVN